MNEKRRDLYLAGFVVVGFLLVAAYLREPPAPEPVSPPVAVKPIEPVAPVKPIYPPVAIAQPLPGHLSYEAIYAKSQEWEKAAPHLVELGEYGRSSGGATLRWIRLTDEKATGPKKTVLFTACIHGNEPWSTGCLMAYVGTMLSEFDKSERIKTLMKTRELYFVPVVSPDTYCRSRHVDGVDPNRNFPGPKTFRDSVPPVKALQELFMKIRPNACVCGHTWGRVYLYPYGDTVQLSPDDAKFKEIVGKMGELSNYRLQRACEMYGHPIFGTSVDWYYRNGAFPIVMEFGTHQKVPSAAEIESEFERTYEAVLYFFEKAPDVELSGDVGFDMNHGVLR